MNAGDWITLAAVLVALGIGVASILHTQSLQRKERLERLLNEIIDWAIAITRWRPRGSIKEVLRTPVNLQRKLFYSEVVGVIEIFVALKGRNQYASDIATTLGSDLKKSVDELIKTLEEKTELLEELKEMIFNTINIDRKEAEAKDKPYVLKASELESKIYQLAFKVIEEATKLKTRDIS